eukprot:SAG31_NODE_51_length_30464_cov_16.835628_2_plen_55_part_00
MYLDNIRLPVRGLNLIPLLLAVPVYILLSTILNLASIVVYTAITCTYSYILIHT